MYYVDFWSYISIVYCVIIKLPVGIKLNIMMHLCNAWEPGKVPSHVPLSPMKELRLCHTWEIIPLLFRPVWNSVSNRYCQMGTMSSLRSVLC
jgi:hypothetical protein